MEELASALLIWIAAHSEYAVAKARPPAIVLVDPAEMQAVADTRASALHSSSPGGRLWGWFERGEGATGVIYLIRPEDTPQAERYADASENPLFRERLLHELVHYAQRVSGSDRTLDCLAQGEADAYRLGGLYLREAGVPDPLPHRRVWARNVSRCTGHDATPARHPQN